MERKKVLVIGMFDSIHLARWLSQFEDQNIEFVLFPSKKFKYLNFELEILIKSKNTAVFTLPTPYFCSKYIGHLDYILNLLFKIFNMDLKKILLKRTLISNKFKLVHAIEIQGAGYLYDSLPKNILDQNTLILTNYGSDIFYFKNISDHNKKIKSVLKKAKFYSGECHRDYELALNLGFNGRFLPCIPNAGGFKEKIFDLNQTVSEKRNLIVVKCYGGIFGLGGLVIEALTQFLINKPNVKVLLYSVTKDLSDQAILLKKNFPGQIIIQNINDKISRTSFLKYFSEAKIYVAASKSDGVSTSFLEALCLGAFPIQTNTSCAQEWINLGFEGDIVFPDSLEILTALNKHYSDPLLDLKRVQNLVNAKVSLSFNLIKNQALSFYGID
jgi:hypothetical protein